jgi:hypothetical protein
VSIVIYLAENVELTSKLGRARNNAKLQSDQVPDMNIVLYFTEAVEPTEGSARSYAKLGLQDTPKSDSSKVPNNNKKYFTQGHSCMIGPYVFHFLIQSGKMSPNHKSETSDGDVSCAEVVLNTLVFVGSVMSALAF